MVKQVRASHILLNSEKDAENIMNRISKGEDFKVLAKRFSKCPSKSKGGDLGWFGRGQMVPEFEEAAFSVPPGSVIGPVKTEFGYHVIFVMEQK